MKCVTAAIRIRNVAPQRGEALSIPEPVGSEKSRATLGCTSGWEWARVSTGNAPGKPPQTMQTSVFGGASAYRAEQPQYILDLVSNWAWTSSPMTGSYFISVIPTRRMFCMPIRLALIHVTDAQQQLLRQVSPHDLHPDGHSVRDAARHRERRDSGEVDRHHVYIR